MKPHRKMKVLVCIVLGTVLAVFLFITSTQGDKSRFLVKFDNETQSYVLNRDVLDDLAKLQRPIRVVAIVGDATRKYSQKCRFFVYNKSPPQQNITIATSFISLSLSGKQPFWEKPRLMNEQ